MERPYSVRLDVPDEVPALPAAIEAATAPDRHRSASPMSYATPGPRAHMVRLRCADRLELSITDDGPPNGAVGPRASGLARDARSGRRSSAVVPGRADAGRRPGWWPHFDSVCRLS